MWDSCSQSDPLGRDRLGAGGGDGARGPGFLTGPSINAVVPQTPSREDTELSTWDRLLGVAVRIWALLIPFLVNQEAA